MPLYNSSCFAQLLHTTRRGIGLKKLRLLNVESIDNGSLSIYAKKFRVLQDMLTDIYRSVLDHVGLEKYCKPMCYVLSE